jgi:TetR/AcrR family transcriptional regulator, cholesterol catabolism regulator
MGIQERIKQKADELFRRYGIRSVTMDEIAKQLGMSKKTIYQYFSDKDELVDAVFTDIIQYNQQCCSDEQASSENAVDEVFKKMRMLQEIFDNLNPSIFFDLERYHPKTYQKFQQHRNKFLYQLLKNNIERGKKEELYRPEINSDMAVRVRLETMMLPFNQQLFPKTKFNLFELEKQMLECFLFSLSTLKGYKLISKYKKAYSLKNNNG